MIKHLASHPVCAANINAAQDDGKEQRHLHLCIWCSISFTGNGFPVFNWTKSNVEKIAANTTASGTRRGLLTNTSSIRKQLHVNDIGVTFQCRITFQLQNNYKEDATNVYKYTWNYTISKQSISYPI